MPETFKQIKGTTVAFGDVVQLSKERSNDPERDGFERYLGLEHLKPSDLKVCSWGDIVDGTTFTSVFKPGQVLFGKRRAYQRKVAVADFSGVCSGDIYVLEPKGDELLPELLPFICQSESFYDYVISMSQGGLSPRVNWKALAKYEFALPPLEEQRRIADALLAFEMLNEALAHAKNTGEGAFRAALKKFMSGGLVGSNSAQTGNLVYPSNWDAVRLEDVASVDRGKFSHRPRNLPKFYGGPYLFAQTGDVAAGRGYRFEASQTLSDEGLQYSRSFPPDTVLVTIAAVIGATAITPTETWCTDSVVGIVPNDSADAAFIEYAMRYRRDYLEHEVATQTAQKNINLAVLRPLLIPWPDAATRLEVVARLRPLEDAVDRLAARRIGLRSITKAILGDGNEEFR